MATLRIVRVRRVHLCDNLPRFNDPRKTTGLRIVRRRTVRIGVALTGTLSGTVENTLGAALPYRTIRVYADQAMINFLGSTYSSASGTFSIAVPGGPASRYTLVAQGEPGENCTIIAYVVKTV